MGEMDTIVWQVDSSNPDPAVLAEAGQMIRRGRLVAFPTETVYGLGANALDVEALEALFAAKGRPRDNPLILHLAAAEDLFPYVREVPLLATKLMGAFWPGPLTLVFFGTGRLPAMVTGGLGTIAARVPAHPVALGIIRAAGVPVVAPSANLSGRPSPTTAAHVLADLRGRIDAVVDGGAAPLGIESTVLDLTGKVPRVLRRGAVSSSEIADVAGVMPEEAPEAAEKDFRCRLRVPLILVEGEAQAVVEKIRSLYTAFAAEGKRVGILTREERVGDYPGQVVPCGREGDTRSVGACLYAALRQLETVADVILAEGLPAEAGAALQRRLQQAASEVVRAEREL
ncbi:MAG: L-threonylcarbamoyladenylate synthase [Bacillota bacterium]